MAAERKSVDDADDLVRGLDDVEELLKRIPGAKRAVDELHDLRTLLVGRRAPRVAVLGRRGSGKSTLGNALLGAEVLATGAVEDTTRTAAWVDLTVHGDAVRWLDTPGLRAGGRPGRRAEVEAVLRAERPDVLVWTFKATQVDAGVDEDLAELVAVRASVPVAGAAVPVVVVVTKVDELAPAGRRAPPFDDAGHRARIDAAVEALRGHLARALGEAPPVVPVCAWQRFDGGVRTADWRWNVERLAAEVHGALPLVAQLSAARVFERGKALRRRLAMRFVGGATSVSFVVGATPLPFADLALLLPLQTTMLTGVVYASGRSWSARAASEWLAGLGVNVGAGMGLREVVRAALRWVPGVGATVSGAVAATGTWALGVAAVRFFIDGATFGEARAAFDAAAKDGPPEDAGGSEG